MKLSCRCAPLVNLLGYIQLITSLLNIFYTTAQFPQQVRLQQPDEAQIKTFSVATAVLLVWRTLIVGSRILAFVLFASLFRHWLFAIIAFHYSLMFALVFYQMRLARKKPITRVVYNVVTPFVYVFDFCVNWLAGPTRYWYVMCYVPMYAENLLIAALGLWYASVTKSPAWYIVPGCVSVAAMFPVGVLVQVAYYRCWHPTVAANRKYVTEHDGSKRLPLPSASQATGTACSQCMTWSDFRNEVYVENHK